MAESAVLERPSFCINNINKAILNRRRLFFFQATRKHDHTIVHEEDTVRFKWKKVTTKVTKMEFDDFFNRVIGFTSFSTRTSPALEFHGIEYGLTFGEQSLTVHRS